MGRYLDIKLISVTKTVDEYGNWTTTENERTVFAEERSVTQNEFYQGAAVGYKPEIKFVLENFMDYQGEPLVEYVPFMGNPDYPIRLTVLRVYNSGDTLELTCYREIEKNPPAPAPEVQNGDTENAD